MKDLLIKKQEFRWSYQKKGTQVLNICTRLLFLFGFAAALMSGSTQALANPTGGNVVGGSATITSTPAELQINQSSQKALIEWNSFDIAAGETTHFYQPNANAIALNRVVNSTQLSTINGNLIANGRVMVINPNGVLIGKGGHVDTAGFVASTADIGNSAFLNGTGTLNFNVAGKANASVVNEGTISVADEGLVALVAPTVRNDGVIAGNLSKLQLGAGDTYGVDLYGDGLISLAVDAGQGARTLTATNTGSLVADGGQVLMTAAAASGVVNSVINTTGLIQAQGVDNHNGEVILTAPGATVNVAGTVDVSGANGGGTIKVGGDYQGGGTLAHAAKVNVASGAVLNASATDNGNGGKVVVWSDKDTSFNGTALAKGGANGGNGGLVETSSGDKILLNGTVDASAANGEAGTYLIDPATLNIKNGSGTATANTVYEQTLESQSQGGTNVVLSATDTITLENLADNQLKGGKGAITLTATGTNGKVVFADKSDKISTTSGAIKVTAGAGGIDIGSLATESGSIILTTSNAGNIVTKDLTLNSKIGEVSTLTVNSAGSLTVAGSISNVNVDDKASADNSGSSTTLAAQGDVNVTGGITASATDEDQPYIGAATTVSVTSAAGNVTVAGPISVAAKGTKTTATTGNGPTVKAAVTVKAAKDVSLNGPVTVVSTASSNADYTSSNNASLDVNGKNVAITGDVNVNATTNFNDTSVNVITSTTNATANITASNNVKVGNVYVNANGVVPVDTLMKFLSTSSSYNDTIGYYTYDANGNPVAGKIIWAGAQDTAANTTLVLPKDQGTIGFFLLSNGKTANPTLKNGQDVTFKKVNGVWQAYSGNTQLTVASSGNGPFFSNAALNPDSIAHTKTVNSNDTGWEDLQMFSDNDYNDVIMNVAPRYNNNNVTATLKIKTDAAGTGVATVGNLEANANTAGTGVAKSTLEVYSSGVLAYNGTHIQSKADGAAAQDNYVGFDINKTVNSGTDQAVERVSSLHLINVKADAKTKIYGDADPTLTYSATFDYAAAANVSTAGYLTGALTRATGNNVGTYVITQGTLTTASSAPVAGRYAVVYTGNNLAITPATLTITALTDTKTYDATTASSKGPSVSGLKYSDTVTGASQSFDSKNAGSRTLTVSGYTVNDGNSGNNYTVVTKTAAGTINKANLTIAAVTDTKTYDATTASSKSVTITGLKGSDTVVGASQSFDNKNAGNRTLTVSGYTLNDGNSGGNYNVTTTSAAGVINKANLTIAAVTDTKTYDATTSSSKTVTVTGLKGSDTVSGATQSYDSKNAGSRTLTVSGYTLNDGNSGGNYNVTTATAAGTINKANLTIAAVADTKTYDATTGSSKSATVTGLQGSDTVTGATQSFDSKNAGNRTLTVSGYALNDGNSGGNYNVTTTTAAGVINKANLTIAAVTDTKTYDATTSSSKNVAITGLKGSDTVAGATQSFDSKNAGSRTLSVNGGYTLNDGNSGGNYNVTTTTAAGTINKANLTIAAVTDTKTYDATTGSSKSVTVSGLKGSDTVTGASQSFDSKNAGSRTLSVNGGYALNDGNSGGNYNVTTTTAAGTINKANLTIAAAGDTKTYDGTTASSKNVTVTGLKGSDTVSGTSQSFDSKNAGSRTLTVSGYTLNDGNSGGNYNVTTTTAAGTINKANLTLAAVSDTKTYDGTTSSTKAPAKTGLVAGDSVTNLSQSFDSKDAGVRTLSVNSGYVVNDGNGGGNYNVVTTTAAGTITQAGLVVTADGKTKTYGDADAALTYTYTGLVAGDSLTGALSRVAGENVGTYAITIGTLASAGNYAITYVGANYTITKATLTIAASSATKTYDATTASSAGPTVSGLKFSDTVTGLSQSYDSKNAGSRTLSVNGGYAVNDGNGGGNYNVVTTTAAGTINKANLTIAALTDTKTYDGTTTSTATGTVTGLKGSDTVTGLSQSYDSKNAGNRTLAVTGYTLNDGNGGGNYNVTTTTAQGAINKANLTIAANGDSKTYDGTTTSSTGPTVTGLVGGDTVTGASQSFDSKNAGNRTLTVSGYTLNDGNSGGNYTVTTTNAAGSISKANLTIAANGDAKTYDGNTSSTATGTVTGLVGGDTVTGVTEEFDSKNAGTRTLTVTGYTLNDGNGGGNYNVTTATAAGTINKASLTIAASGDSKTYDGTTTSSTGPTVTGLVGGDTVTGASQSFDNKNAGNRTLSVNGGYAVNDGNNGGNYTVTTTNAAGTINKASLVINATSDTKTYDGNTSSAAVATATGLVSGDLLAIGPQEFDSPNVGSRTLAVTGYALNDGNGGNNYSVTLNTAAGSITAAPVTNAGVGNTIEFSGLQRPVISVADKVINYDDAFEPRETQTMSADISVKADDATASQLANLEPAAGGDDEGANTKKKRKGKVAQGATAQDLANIEPAAGGAGPVQPKARVDSFGCADSFLEGKGCQ